MKEKINKLITVYQKHGFIGFMKKLYKYIVANYFDKISFKTMILKKKYKKELKDIIESSKAKRIVLWRSSFGYNVALFQRPQHIANNLAKNGCLVFYEVTTMTDKVKIFKKKKDNVYLFNFNNIKLNKILMDVLSEVDIPKYIQLYSTDWKLTIKDIENYIDKGFKFIYEYVDDLSPELAGTKFLPKNITDKYEYVLTHDDVYMVVTAKTLEDIVVKRRGRKNLVLSSNGVDYDFFKTYDEDYEFESEFQEILDKKKPIICYYGSLAMWCDYELIKKIADSNKYSIVLFGIKYDASFEESGIENLNNVYFLGTRDYTVLKNYARKCDIMTIPFLLNNITKSTSPVKIFEYMALHKPIVITDLEECRQYKSVMIGHDHDEFMKCLDLALKKKNDKKYIELLDKEAKENDWAHKAQVIIDLIEKDEK